MMLMVVVMEMFFGLNVFCFVSKQALCPFFWGPGHVSNQEEMHCNQLDCTLMPYFKIKSNSNSSTSRNRKNAS